LTRLRQLLLVGLTATAAWWPPLQVAYTWVWQAAHLLGEKGAGVAATVRRQLGGLLGAMRRHRDQVGPLASAVDHFVKVTRSYWSGLFHCYEVVDLPRTNNDLEQFFGRYRYHERRSTGRRGASPGLVLRGQVRLLAAAATRQRRYDASELAEADLTRCAEVRRQLQVRRRRRVSRRRFRRDPQAFLQQLEDQLLRSILPS
jgi:hypothetical protein